MMKDKKLGWSNGLRAKNTVNFEIIQWNFREKKAKKKKQRRHSSWHNLILTKGKRGNLNRLSLYMLCIAKRYIGIFALVNFKCYISLVEWKVNLKNVNFQTMRIDKNWMRFQIFLKNIILFHIHFYSCNFWLNIWRTFCKKN